MRLALATVFALLVAGPLAAAEERIDARTIMHAAQASMPEFLEFLSLPNDAINAADVRKNADWLEAAFRKRGFATQQLPNDGKPLVFAELGPKRPGARTILFYMHFDGQPVIPEEWAQASPWKPVLKRRKMGASERPAPLPTFTPARAREQDQWEEIATSNLGSGDIDPEWRIFARSASDDKAPIMMLLAALDLMKASGIEPRLNIKVLLDSEEEKGSPGIGKVASAHRDLLNADAILIHDGPLHASNQPTIIFGNRGNTLLRLTVFGPKGDLHSGHYGNYVPNPAQRLAALLASMKDGEGRVIIPGYYDSVRLSEAERQILAAVPEDEAAIRKRLGIAKPENVGRNLQEALQYPSLNIRGMAAAAVGDKASNIIPNSAVAELDLRTTPGATPKILTGLIAEHIRRQGYYLIDRDPTDEERAAHDRIASLTTRRGSEAAFTAMDSDIGAWTQRVLAETFAEDGQPAATVRIRMMGGSVPTDKLIGALGLPFAIVPLVNPDNNQHSHNENLRLGHYLQGIRAFTGLLRAE